MGLQTLSQFRSSLVDALGVDKGNTRNDRWINTGYFDLTGAVEFIELRSIVLEPVLANANTVAAPTDVQWIKHIVDLTNEQKLYSAVADQWVKLDPDTKGKPQYWYRWDEDIRVWPTPKVETDLNIMYMRRPPALAADADETKLPATWDRAVELLSISHALLDLNEEQRSNDILGRAMSYIRSRLIADDMEMDDREFALGHMKPGQWKKHTRDFVSG